jgi:hypothetical protein
MSHCKPSFAIDSLNPESQTPQRLAIGSFWKLLNMTFSRSQRTVPAMGALIVWSEEERAKDMVF